MDFGMTKKIVVDQVHIEEDGVTRDLTEDEKKELAGGLIYGDDASSILDASKDSSGLGGGNCVTVMNSCYCTDRYRRVTRTNGPCPV